VRCATSWAPNHRCIPGGRLGRPRGPRRHAAAADASCCCDCSRRCTGGRGRRTRLWRLRAACRSAQVCRKRQLGICIGRCRCLHAQHAPKHLGNRRPYGSNQHAQTGEHHDKHSKQQPTCCTWLSLCWSAGCAPAAVAGDDAAGWGALAAVSGLPSAAAAAARATATAAGGPAESCTIASTPLCHPVARAKGAPPRYHSSEYATVTRLAPPVQAPPRGRASRIPSAGRRCWRRSPS
jgi:hypothetical protein